MKICLAVWLMLFVSRIATAALGAEPVVAAGAKPEMLQESGAGEGPAWHPEFGLLTSGDGHIMRRDRDGKMSVYRRNAGSNGLLFDRQGRLVICEPAQRRVTHRVAVANARSVPPAQPTMHRRLLWPARR